MGKCVLQRSSVIYTLNRPDTFQASRRTVDEGGRTVGRLARARSWHGNLRLVAEQLDASRALGLSTFVRPLGGQWLTGRARWACLNCPRPNPPGDSDERESRRYRPSLGRPLRTPSVVGNRPIRRGVVGAVSVASTVTPSRPSRRGRIGRGIGKVRKLPRIGPRLGAPFARRHTGERQRRINL